MRQLQQPMPATRPTASPRRAGESARGPLRVPRRASRGVTLVELLVSLSILAIVITALGSVMVLTSHAVGLSATQAVEARTDDVAATLAAEQRLALRVLERTNRSITFVVDRDHDGTTETIGYAWSGVSGDPLTRSLNGGVPVPVVANCKRFNLSYVTRTTAPAVVPDVEVANDVLLYAHTGGIAAAPISTTSWAAQYFKPDWAAVAPGKTVTGWRVTRIEIVSSLALVSSGTTPWVVRLYSAGADQKPVLSDKKDEVTLAVSGMVKTNSPSLPVSTGALGANSALDPAKGMCVTVGGQAFSPEGYVGFNSASTDPAGAFMTSINSGVSYGTPSGTRDMKISVWGRYTYPGP